MNKHFTKAEDQMIEIVKRFSTLLIKKMHIKVSVEYFIKPTKVKTSDRKVFGSIGTRTSLVCVGVKIYETVHCAHHLFSGVWS